MTECACSLQRHYAVQIYHHIDIVNNGLAIISTKFHSCQKTLLTSSPDTPVAHLARGLEYGTAEAIDGAGLQASCTAGDRQAGMQTKQIYPNFAGISAQLLIGYNHFLTPPYVVQTIDNSLITISTFKSKQDQRNRMRTCAIAMHSNYIRG